MKLLLLFAAVIGLGYSRGYSAALDDLWGHWKSQHTKMYDDEATESVRRLAWESNWRFVQQHNSEGHGYEVEMNEFADLVSCVSRSSLRQLGSMVASRRSKIDRAQTLRFISYI